MKIEWESLTSNVIPLSRVHGGGCFILSDGLGECKETDVFIKGVVCTSYIEATNLKTGVMRTFLNDLEVCPVMATLKISFIK